MLRLEDDREQEDPGAPPPGEQPPSAPAPPPPQLDAPQGDVLSAFEPGPAASPGSMAEQLVSAQGVAAPGAGAQGLGGTFQRAGTEGGAQFRSPDFYRGRSTGPPELAGSVGSGAPFVGGGVGGERDDESAIFNAMRRAKKFR